MANGTIRRLVLLLMPIIGITLPFVCGCSMEIGRELSLNIYNFDITPAIGQYLPVFFLRCHNVT